MPLIALVFVACLGDKCQTVQLPFDGTSMQCMLFGQQAAAEWLRHRDGWALRRGYRCETGAPA